MFPQLIHLNILIFIIKKKILIYNQKYPNQYHYQNSKIKYHHLQTFPHLKFPKNTTKITFNHTNLNKIPTNTFQNLSSLITIKFTKYSISSITINTFSKIISLQNLQFKIYTINNIHQHTFTITKQQLKIKFSKSIIHYIHSFTFFTITKTNKIN